MSNYSKTSFYKLECKDPKITDIYVGSTTNFFKRKSQHKGNCINKHGKTKFNQPVYCFMRLHGGWENWNMIEIDEVNCRSKRHKNQIEAKYIRYLGATLNRVIPQDIDDRLGGKEYYRQYSENNRESLAEKHKVYREKNREKISEKRKQHRKKNLEKISENKKKYYEKNREKIIEKVKVYKEKNREKVLERKREWYKKIAGNMKEKVKCECGYIVSKGYLKEHKKTQKHQDWENLPEPNLIFVD